MKFSHAFWVAFWWLLEPTWPENPPKMESTWTSKSTKNRSKIVLGAKMAPGPLPRPPRSPTWLQLGPNLAPTWPQLGPTWPNLAPTWANLASTWPLSWLKLPNLVPTWLQIWLTWPHMAFSWVQLAPTWLQFGSNLTPPTHQKCDAYCTFGTFSIFSLTCLGCAKSGIRITLLVGWRSEERSSWELQSLGEKDVEQRGAAGCRLAT